MPTIGSGARSGSGGYGRDPDTGYGSFGGGEAPASKKKQTKSSDPVEPKPTAPVPSIPVGTPGDIPSTNSDGNPTPDEVDLTSPVPVEEVAAKKKPKAASGVYYPDSSITTGLNGIFIPALLAVIVLASVVA